MKIKPGLLIVLLSGVFLLTRPGSALAASVKLTDERVTIPTYLLGEPEPNPIFYDGRGSQGAQGRVYPYPLYDSLTSVKSNKTYRILRLENDYVRIGILPEIGGRLFEAIDKSNGYDFVYRQHVIKPALIGLIGAWISGGIEWNIPHHHRATTALPVECQTQENPDGSKTVWVGELELRHRMRWAVGYTLRPDRSYLECSVRIVNRTPFANSMLCFANVAVHVNQTYQVIYPPRTQFVTFHSKHEFTTWPIATTRYAGADFTRGVDVSWYSNHFSANSMFAWNCQDDFFAGYDHGRHAGIMSVADHQIVPGKKFWTWGNGPRGRMWDKILTDSDGPYIELMVGAYSDNQPDYSWLQPYETKSFKLYWYPFRDIDGVKNANTEAAVNLESTGAGTVKIGFCTTAKYTAATAVLTAGTNVLLKETFQIGPGKPYLGQVTLPKGIDEHDLRAALMTGDRELVAYSPVRLEKAAMPQPVQDPPRPEEVKSIEELYLAGQRIEQFHAANRGPEPYWAEALRRDPGDARVNTAWAIRLLKEARFHEAEDHLHKAIQRLTQNYTAPKDGEPFYYLGVALRGRALVETGPDNLYDAAVDAFYKATWSQAWRDPAYFALAELASLRGDHAGALSCVNRALEANALNIRALTLKAALLRRAGRLEQAREILTAAAEAVDPLDARLIAEEWLTGDQAAAQRLAKVFGQFPAAGLETAVEYGNAGLWQDGVAVLKLLTERTQGPVSPLVYYYLGEFEERLGDERKASEYRQLAAQASPDYCFPFQNETIPALRHAIERNPRDAFAPYYLGNLLYDWQPQEAVKLWEQAESLNPSFAIVHRNLALAYSRQEINAGDTRSIDELEKAVGSPAKYALHFAELDQLYAKAGMSPAKRLALFKQNQEVISKRDDSLSREIGLMVFAGDYDRAIELMTGRKFSVWEGGTLEVAQHWINAHLLKGRKEIKANQAAAALADFQQAKIVPENLPNDTESENQSFEISYWTGLAYHRLGDNKKSLDEWESAAQLSPKMTEQLPGFRQGRQIYFSAQAQKELGNIAEAKTIFERLLDSATQSFNQNPEDKRPGRTGRRPNPALAHCLAGLAHVGLGHLELAKAEFNKALELDPELLTAEAELSALR